MSPGSLFKKCKLLDVNNSKPLGRRSISSLRKLSNNTSHVKMYQNLCVEIVSTLLLIKLKPGEDSKQVD